MKIEIEIKGLEPIVALLSALTGNMVHVTGPDNAAKSVPLPEGLKEEEPAKEPAKKATRKRAKKAPKKAPKNVVVMDDDDSLDDLPDAQEEEEEEEEDTAPKSEHTADSLGEMARKVIALSSIGNLRKLLDGAGIKGKKVSDCDPKFYPAIFDALTEALTELD